MYKNALALIGLVTVVNYGIKGFEKYLKEPLERKLTEVFDDESKRMAKGAYTDTAAPAAS